MHNRGPVYKIRTYTSDDWKNLLAFIVQENAKSEQHICYYGVGVAEIEAYLKVEHEQPIDDTYLLAFRGEQLAGVIGLEYNLDVKRAWIEGPLTNQKDWKMLGERLYTKILSRIPDEINDYELCGGTQNKNLRELAIAHGFTPNESDSLLLGLTKQQNHRYQSVNLQELSREYFPSFNKLHNKLFPNTYYNAIQLLERMGDTQKVFIIADGKEVRGYICVDIVPERHDAYIHFLGVDPQYRLHGLGSRLLAGGCQWALSDQGIKHIGLSVRASNAGARGLYNRTGFVIERRLRGYRKRLA